MLQIFTINCHSSKNLSHKQLIELTFSYSIYIEFDYYCNANGEILKDNNNNNNKNKITEQNKIILQKFVLNNYIHWEPKIKIQN